MTVTNTSPPVITGTAQQGQTLQSSTGTWTFSQDYLTYAYQWERCNAGGGSCADIAGATGSSYVLQAADVGSTIRAEVTATEHANPVGPTPVYEFNFETGDFSQVTGNGGGLQQKAVGRISLITSPPADVLEGVYTAWFKNSSFDHGVAVPADYRTEIQFGEFGTQFGFPLMGQDTWMTWEMKLASNFEIPPSGQWTVISQFYNSGGSPTMGFQIGHAASSSGYMYVIIRGGTPPGSARSYTVQDPLQRNTLLRFKVFRHWSTSSSGRTILWINDVQVLDDTGPNSYIGYETTDSQKGGMYHYWVPTIESQLWYDNLQWWDSDPGNI